MTILLLADSLTVFYNILLYMGSEVKSIFDIKSVYSNKNILAAAIFVKMPFALWLISFEKHWLRKLGFLALFAAELAIFFMSTRAFYLGLIILVILNGLFLIISGSRQKSIPRDKTIFLCLGTLAIAFIIYSLTQHYLFPNKDDLYNKSFTKRFASIKSGEPRRLESWQRSFALFKREPILGVGTGNWKVRVLQYEIPETSGFTYMVKNHNDFMEISVETGIFGGLLYLTMFSIIFLNFLKALFKTGSNESSYRLLFLPAFGLVCYSIDAFFNFPADRPEMQSLFAFFIGSGIAFSNNKNIRLSSFRPLVTKSLIFLLFLVLLPTGYILLLNVKALKIQRLVQADGLRGELTYTSDIFIEGYPKFFNLSCVSEPIAEIKARYLLNENKYSEAINILTPDHASPYDSRGEYIIAKAYSGLENNDSALLHARKAYALKPRFYDPCGFICFNLKRENKINEAIQLSTEFLTREKETPRAWIDLASFYRETGNYSMAIQTIDTASKYLPADTAIAKKRIELFLYRKIVPYQQDFTTAMGFYNKMDYPGALALLNSIISKEPRATIVYSRRAVCYLHSKEYQKCITDVNISIEGGYDTPELINLRGAAYHGLKQDANACEDFKNSASRGNRDAVANMERICKSLKK
jgi:tetratricopeptide (TPR) repeat protein